MPCWVGTHTFYQWSSQPTCGRGSNLAPISTVLQLKVTNQPGWPSHLSLSSWASRLHTDPPIKVTSYVRNGWLYSALVSCCLALAAPGETLYSNNWEHTRVKECWLHCQILSGFWWMVSTWVHDRWTEKDMPILTTSLHFVQSTLMILALAEWNNIKRKP